MTSQEVRFTDPELQSAFGPFLSDSLTWDRFFAAAEAFSALGADELVELQSALVEAVVAGRYGGLPRKGPVSFLDEDGELPGGIAFGRVVSHDDDLPRALADLDALRAAKGERAARRWMREVVADESGGHSGHVLLLTVLPRAHRLRTGSAMPGYRAYRQEEARAPGARAETRTVLLEVEHDGVPGLIATEVAAHSEFQLQDALDRDVAALQALVPFAVRAAHRGEPISSEWRLDRRRERDGEVLFRGGLAVPEADEAWVAALRAAMLTPARKQRALPVAEFWATVAAAGPGDPDVLAEVLTGMLARWTPARIRAFDAALQALLAGLDTPESLAAASAVFGWLSDDAWEDVRLGVVAQGETSYAGAVREPASFDWASVEPGESLLSAASDAHEARTGGRIEADLPSSGTWTGAVVLSRRDDEVCLRRWADAATALERHLAAEEAGAEVLALRPELDRARLRESVLMIAPGPLL